MDENQFLKSIQAYRQQTQMMADLKDALVSLKATSDKLSDEILAYLGEHPEAYNICHRKTISLGVLGSCLIQCSYGRALAARNVKTKLDDQKFLGKMRDLMLEGGIPGSCYLKNRLVLNKELVKADYAAGSLNDQDLRELGLCYEPTMSLAVKTIRTKSELDELRDKALEAADKAEAEAED